MYSNFSIDGNPLNALIQFSICYLKLIKSDFSMNQKFKSGSIVLMKKNLNTSKQIQTNSFPSMKILEVSIDLDLKINELHKVGIIHSRRKALCRFYQGEANEVLHFFVKLY